MTFNTGYEGLEGLCRGKGNAAEDWNARVASAREREVAWLRGLVAQGVKACHPDDGWVDREENKVHFVYPQFLLGPQPGDIIALGRSDKWRLVRVTKVQDDGRLFGPFVYHYFEPVAPPVVEHGTCCKEREAAAPTSCHPVK